MFIITSTKYSLRLLCAAATLALCISACARNGNNSSLFGAGDNHNNNTTINSNPTAPTSSAATPLPAPSGNEANESAYARAYKKLKEASSYHFALKTDGMPGRMNADTHTTAEGVYVASTRSWQYKLTGAENGGTLNKEFLKINSSNKNYAKEGGAWIERSLLDFTDASVDLIEGSFAPSRPDMNRMGLPQMVGMETIDGQECEHYHFDVTGESMFKGSYDAYLSRANGEFIRLDKQESLNKFTLKLSQLNAPVEIEQPN